MKPRANQQEVNMIKRLLSQGKTVQQISKLVGIHEDCVQTFADVYGGKSEDVLDNPDDVFAGIPKTTT